MQQFLLRRLAQALLALFALSILTFLLVRITSWPNVILLFPCEIYDSSDYYKHVERHLVVAYASYTKDVVSGGWGASWKWCAESKNLVLERLVTTLLLAALALALSTFLGITLGILAAIHKGSPFDRWNCLMIFFGRSIPVFWLGIFLIWIFAVLLNWLPSSGSGGFTHVILPVISLALLPTAVLAKLTRSATLSALESNYVKLARIKGLSKWKVIWNHCLRNVAVSPAFSFGLIGGAFLTSLVLTEVVFDWPGVGLLAFESLHSRDNLLLHSVVFFFGAVFILCHLVADILRAFLDPRIRHSAGAYPQYEV